MAIGTAVAVAWLLVFTGGAAIASDCTGNADALGTSRVIVADPAKLPRVGTYQYSETLPLQDHEIVLTFDDGPLAPHTQEVLDALAAECVKATFFTVGSMAHNAPALLRRVREEGHTIGTHTQSHRDLSHTPYDEARKEIDAGIASASAALGDSGAAAPFFRFPYLNKTKAIENYALSKGLMIWGVDLWAGDWELITPAQVTAQTLRKLDQKGRGIILFHDIHKRTALALPGLLRELKKRGYRVVHVVPANSPRTASAMQPPAIP